ncbi:hypothetical protein QVD17_26340 [Tagetes erecta]|uniref:BAG domain-containing protein n=1 Tax=Tagetes erecta TaxID=13708 RepID=A0AAD8K976_TARER|nr:hypothetical protein QVD17_26340 [Tagetes erecta]
MDSAALKIQKVFRGFMVRKNVKKIVSIRNEVSEIERRVNDIEFVNSIRRDGKERLRVNETIMCLVLKLDSIRSFDWGVKELRKMVTKKAIALQDKVDSIAQVGIFCVNRMQANLMQPSNFLKFEAEGTRLGRVHALSTISNQELIKITSIERSNHDHTLLPKTDELTSKHALKNRRLVTKKSRHVDHWLPKIHEDYYGPKHHRPRHH